MDLLSTGSSTALQETVNQAKEFIDNSSSASTKRAYRSDWKHFVGWCKSNGFSPLPAMPETICLYLSQLASTKKLSTIRRRVASISQAHKSLGHESPTEHTLVRKLLRGIIREKTVQQTRKSALLLEDLRKILSVLPENKKGIRDRALLLIGFAGAFRRSELVGLEVKDLNFVVEGLVINLRKSKTDQEGKGFQKAIPYGLQPATCPVEALKNWLGVSGIQDGFIFRGVDRHGNVSKERLSPKVVAEIVKACAILAGIEATNLSAHSLRAGFCTQAAIKGATETTIMSVTGHKNADMVRRYIREKDRFRNLPNLGL